MQRDAVLPSLSVLVGMPGTSLPSVRVTLGLRCERGLGKRCLQRSGRVGVSARDLGLDGRFLALVLGPSLWAPPLLQFWGQVSPDDVGFSQVEACTESTAVQCTGVCFCLVSGPESLLRVWVSGFTEDGQRILACLDAGLSFAVTAVLAGCAPRQVRRFLPGAIMAGNASPFACQSFCNSRCCSTQFSAGLCSSFVLGQVDIGSYVPGPCVPCQQSLLEPVLCPSHRYSASLAASSVLGPEVDLSVWGAVEEWFCALFRTCILFYLLSVCHLLLWSCPCKAGREKRNKSLRCSRSFFTGAPILWAFFAVAHLLPVATAMPPQRASLQEHTVPCDRSDQLWQGDSIIWGPNLPVSEVALRKRHEELQDFKMQVEVVQFQRPSFCLEQIWCDGHNTSLLLCEAYDELGFDRRCRALFPVWPQPSLDVVVLLEPPVWLIEQLSCPVLIQVGEPRQVHFLEYFTGQVTHADIRMAMGPRWPAGAFVFVGDCNEPLGEFDACNPFAGMLIRVTSRRQVPQVRPLDYKLRKPEIRLRDLTKLPMRVFDSYMPCVGVVGPMANWHTIPIGNDWTPSLLQGCIADECGLLPGSFRVKLPCQLPYDLAFRGLHVSSLVGVVSKSLDQCVCLFVDPRALGKPVQTVMLPSQPITIRSLLHLIGASFPSGHELVVKGAPFLCHSTQEFVPGHAAMVIFDVEFSGSEYEDAAEHRNAAAGLIHDNRMDQAPPAPDVGRHLVSGVHLADLVGQDVIPVLTLARDRGELQDEAVEDVVPSLMHGWTSCELGLHGTPALPTSRPALAPDLSASSMTTPGYDVKAATVLVSRRERDDQLSGPSDLVRDVVMRANAGLAREVFPDLAGPILQHIGDDGDSEGSVHSEAEGDVGVEVVDSPDEWLLLIKILRHQRPAEFASLWISSEDSVDSFMQRAQILLVPPNGFFQVVLPETQPERHCLTVLVYPLWWNATPAKPFVIMQSGEEAVPFMQVAWPEDEWEELLPLHGQRREERVQAYTDFVDEAVPLTQWPFPPVGATVLLHSAGLPMPSLPSAEEVLANRLLSIRREDVPNVRHRAGMRYALLGLGFEQTVIELRAGAVMPQVCRVLNIPASEVIMSVQVSLFDQMEVQGVDVGRCIAYRSVATTRRNEGTMIFIDCRLVGRPVCCRMVSRAFLSAGDFLRMLDVVLPQGYHAMQRRGRDDNATEHTLQFLHCQSSTLWVVNSNPPPAVAQIPEHEDEDDESASDDEVVPDTPHPNDRPDVRSSGARSRSPRGGPIQSRDDTCDGRDGSADVSARYADRCVATPCRSVCRTRASCSPLARVHQEAIRFSTFGVVLALVACEVEAGFSPAFSSSIHDGVFLADEKGLMWKPGYQLDVRLPHHLADTSDVSYLRLSLRHDVETVRDQYLGEVAQAMSGMYEVHVGTGGLQSVNPCGNRPPAYSLCLEQLLPVGQRSYRVKDELGACQPDIMSFQLDAGQCVTSWNAELERDLCRFVPFSQLRWPPKSLEQACRFDAWVEHGIRRSPAPGETLLLTSDGSYNPSTGMAGWGLVLAVTTDDDRLPTFIGCCWGSLRAFVDVDASIVGSVDAYVAEIAGAFWAAVGALQLRVSCPLRFRCDNLAALGVASGANAHADVPIRVAMRALHQCISVRLGGAPCYEHVRGHVGDQQNELADGLAKYAACHGLESGPFQLDLVRWFANGGGAFHWVTHAVWSRSYSSFGPSFEDGILAWDRHAPGLKVPAIEVIQPFLPDVEVAVDMGNGASHVKLCVATYNCLSLAEGACRNRPQVAFREVGRAKLLAECLAASKVQLASVQESRDGPGMYHCGSFVRFASGPDKERNYGLSFGWTKPLHLLFVISALRFSSLPISQFCMPALLRCLSVCGIPPWMLLFWLRMGHTERIRNKPRPHGGLL